MKHIKLKKILTEMMNESSQESVEFNSGAEILPQKMGKNFPPQEDAPVRVVAFGYYQDNRFDHAFGTHDPGSGFIAEKLEIYALEDIKAYDEAGNETSEVLFKKNQKIDEKFISEDSIKYLEDKAADALTNNADYRKNQYDGDRE